MDEVRRVFATPSGASTSATLGPQSTIVNSAANASTSMLPITPAQALVAAVTQWANWLFSTYGTRVMHHVAQMVVLLLLLKLVFHIYGRLAGTR